MALAIPAALAVRLSWSDQRGIPEQLDLKKALEIAVANNPQLKAARNEIEITEAKKLRLRSGSIRLSQPTSRITGFSTLRWALLSDSGNHRPTGSGDRDEWKTETANASCRTEEPGAKSAN